jgi:membrane-bound metal-dependent hydrolase YbcI (DUF457 family)
MDPATHALFGAALVIGASSAPKRAVVATCAGASLLPDVDAVLMPAGWDRYLVAHEAGTHSLAGAVLLAGLLALALGRWRPALRDWRIRAAAVAGTTGHVFWDLANGGDIRLFWPAWPLRIGGHLAAMADPLILAPLLLFAVVAFASRRRARPAAAVVLLLLAGVLVGRLGLQQRALAAHARTASPNPADAGSRSRGGIERRAIESEWGSVAGWWVYDRRADAMRVWHVDGWNGRAVLRERVRIDDAAVAAAAEELPPAHRAVGLWDFAFVRSRPHGSGRDVLLSDLRFCSGGECGLWFGGHVDATGAATEEIVIVGPWRLTRPVAR